MTLTLDRAQQLNAFTHELQAGFASALKQVRDPERAGRDDHRGRRGFCVGRDLDEAPADRDAYRRLGDHHIPNITTLRALQKPVIAAVNGAAAGAGLSLAAASDIRVRRPRPSPSPPGSTSAWCPTRGGLVLRPRIIGYARALEWFATDRHMSAEEALAVGLVSELAESDALLERACELARRFTAMPPRAVGMTKRARGLAAFDAAAAASARARDASRGDPPAPQERMHAGPTEEIGSDPAYTPPGTRRPSG